MTAAVVATAYGGPKVLSVVDLPIGDRAPDEVLIEVRAIGTNPIDYKVFSGAINSDPEKLPMRIGGEASGVIVAVDDGTEGPAGPLHVGDEVIAYRISGAYAAEVQVPATSVLPKPSTLSFEQAAGLMLTGTTAVHTMIATAAGSGDTVLVHGAAGGVGLMIVQLARLAGARVIGTASENHHAFLSGLGAEPVTYGDGLLDRVRALAPNGVDVAIDTVGSDEAIDISLALVANRDRIATIAAFARGGKEGIKVLGGGPGADPGADIRSAARLQLVRQAEEGKLIVPIASVYPLQEVTKALEELKSRHAQGKIILVP